MPMERYRRGDTIRDELARRWPDVRWSVRTVGQPPRVVIRWDHGPRVDEVRQVAYDHEGRRYVRLEREGATVPAVAPLDGIPPETPVAEPVPFDDRSCASCGGELVWDAHGDTYRHRVGDGPVCPCARCGTPDVGNRYVGDVVLCPRCTAEREPVGSP